MALSPLDSNKSIDISLQQVPDSKKTDQEVEFSVKPSVIKFKDTDQKGGNTLINLENALLERFGFDPEKLGKEDREMALQEIRPKITGFHGKLPRKDKTNVESPIEFETYMLGELKVLKLKMLWQVDVNINGKKETIECEQYVKTSAWIPDSPVLSEFVEHGKHMALLHAKFIRKVHKKALLSNYELVSGKKLETDKLIEGLRASNIYDISHYGNPLLQQQSMAYFSGHLVAGKGEAHYSKMKFDTGESVTVEYNPQYGPKGIKGRTVRPMTVKKGDTLPDGSIAEKDMSGYLKVRSHNPSILKKIQEGTAPQNEAIAYGQHMHRQAQHGVIKDPIYESYNNLVSQDFDNIEDALKKENGKLDKQKAKSKDEIRNSNEDPEFKKLMEAVIDGLYKNRPNKKRLKEYEESLFSSTYKAFKNNEKSLGKMLKKAVPQFDNAKEEYELAKQLFEAAKGASKKEALKEKTEALENLRDSFFQMQDILRDYNRLKSFEKGLERNTEHIALAGPDSEKKTDRYKHKVLVEICNGRLKNYSKKMNSKKKQFEDIQKEVNSTAAILKKEMSHLTA